MLDTLPSESTRKFKQYVATISVSMGAFCAGTVLSWTSPALSHVVVDSLNGTNVTLQEKEDLSSPAFRINNEEVALIGSIATIGALIAAIPTGWLADKFGRKIIILALSMPFLLNWLMMIFATSVEIVVIARFFAGIGLGGICVVAPMYIGEISEPTNRGMFGSFFQLFLSSGILFTCIIGSFTDWTNLAIVLAVSPVIFGISFFFMPETPVYLVDKNKLDDAEKILKELRGSNCDISIELKAIQKENAESKKKSATISDIILNKGNLRAAISIFGVLAFMQLSGVNAVVFYTATIFKTAGTNLSPNLSAIIINLVQVIVSYVSILVIEKANRKFFLMLSSTGMLLCLASLGMFFHLKNVTNVAYLGFIPLGSTILYMISFSFGYGPVPWMLMSELFSPEIKGIATGMAILVNWIFAFIVTYCFPIMNETLGGHVTFYIFAALMALATLFVHFVVPETRGKSLIEIQEELNR